MKGPSVNPGSSLPGSTSTSLLAKLRSHDPAAWVHLADLYGPLVYSWCRRRGLNENDAADVVQEVFRAVATNIQNYVHGPGSNFRGWLWTITRSKLMDHFRRQERQPPAPGGTDAQKVLAEIPEALDESDAACTTGNLVRRALEAIRSDFKEPTWQAFWRVAMDGQSPADVARDLQMSINYVYVARSRVLRRLRDELGEDFV